MAAQTSCTQIFYTSDYEANSEKLFEKYEQLNEYVCEHSNECVNEHSNECANEHPNKCVDEHSNEV